MNIVVLRVMLLNSVENSLLNGSQVDTAQKRLNLDIADLSIGLLLDREGVEHSSTLMAIVNAVKKEKIAIRDRGYTDTFLGRIMLKARVNKSGEVVPDRNDKSINSHFAYVLSTYELNLIAPCFNVAKEATDFTITMLQYDGFSIRLDKGKDRLQQVLDRLNREVATVANKYGINTKLICKR